MDTLSVSTRTVFVTVSTRASACAFTLKDAAHPKLIQGRASLGV